MKQIYKHYKYWEDYQSGMFDLPDKDSEEELIDYAVFLLCDEESFLKTSLQVLEEWVNASDVNLSNINSNRRSWIGQSACCFKYGIPELLTRVAWSRMTSEQRNKANLIADKVIKTYEERHRKLHSGMGTNGLF